MKDWTNRHREQSCNIKDIEVNELSDIIPSAEERQEIHKNLEELPENESLFKCHLCKYIFDIHTEGTPVLMALIPKDDVRCPNCRSKGATLMCKVDAYSIFLKVNGLKCRDEKVINGTDICPICKTSICPQCFNHSVVSLSRVTGYVQDVSGWNAAKKQELMDRKRYNMKPRIEIPLVN